MSSEYDNLKLEHQLCFPLYAASREVIKQYGPYLKALNLTYTQYITMMAVWEEGVISVKELGNKLFLDSGTLSPVLKSLESKNYIRRFRSSEDERVLLVEATPEGETLRKQAAHVPEQVASCIDLEEEEAAQLYGLLYKVLSGLSQKG
ncbi:MAG: MarR family transcriptional regulator [Firmicutes bacterium]|nr:MarR family transcriptional regulator [Bacillota bacterium]